MSERIVQCNLTGCHYHGNLPLIDIYEKIFGERKTEMPFEFGAGAQFIVSKDRIRERPREFYRKVYELLQHETTPTDGFIIERFQKLIFS